MNDGFNRTSLALGLLLILVLTSTTGCWLLEEEELPPLEHSPGFFADFDRQTDEALALSADAEKSRRLRRNFATFLTDGPTSGFLPDEDYIKRTLAKGKR